MIFFEDGSAIEEKEIQSAHDEIVSVIKKYTSSVNAGKYIIDELNLDKYSEIKDD